KGIIPTVATLNAEPAIVDRAVAAFGPEDVVVANMVGQGAADPTIRANTLDRRGLLARHERQAKRLVRQRPRGTDRRTLAAGNAGTVAHRLPEGERNTGNVALACAADDLVRLHIIAAADSAVTEGARRMVHGNHGRRSVPPRAVPPNGEGHRSANQSVAPAERFELAIASGPFAGAGRRMIGKQKCRKRPPLSFDQVAAGPNPHSLL